MYHYDIELGGKLNATEVDRVVSASFGGKKDVAIEATYTSESTGATSTLEEYLSITSKGVTVVGEELTSSFSTTTITFSPALIKIPSSAVAGQTYTFSYNANENTVINKPRQTVKNSYKITDKVQLLTTKPFTLKVGKSNFQVYEVRTTETSPAGTTMSESWFDPKVGLIQTVNDGGTVTLTSYTP